MTDQDAILRTPAPSFADEQVKEIVGALFGLSGEFLALDSERDQNIRITTESGEQYAIKIANRAEDRTVLEMQARALQHIASVDASLPVPRVVASRNGLLVEKVYGSHSVQHCVRVLTYLAGKRPWDHPTDWELLRPAGACLARLDLALRGFFHPAAGVALLWDLKHSSELRRYLPYVPDAVHQELARYFLDRFDTRVRPVLPTLRAQVTHNDFVPDNMLVAEEEPTHIVGVIDFGDMTHTPLINNLACTIASMMREHSDLVAPAAEIITGYKERIPLEPGELGLLYDLIGTRLVAMGIIACWRATLHPDNHAYIYGGVERVWATLEAWRGLDPDAVSQGFLRVCGL